MKKNLTYLLVLPCLMIIACHDIHKSDQPAGCADEDGDGYCSIPSGGEDCNDDDPDIHPGAEEICGDKIDQNCNGTDLACDCVDEDEDGFCDDEDCDDDDPDINPDAPEICDDEVDNDCDGLVDEADEDCDPDCTDADSDGFCSEETGGDDCDDLRSLVNPDADEICGNGRDDDCDGLIDEGCGSCDDCDGDGYDSEASGGSDCNDSDASVHPGAEEICGNGRDDDCDGLVDEGCGSCDDCDGDGYDSEASGGSDCNDSDASIHPGATEICGNGRDDDCDGLVDEGCGSPGDLYTFRIYADIGTTDRTDFFVATGTIYPAGIGTVGTYYNDSVGLSDTEGSRCRFTSGDPTLYCELQLPYNADFTNINFHWSFTSDGRFWGCRWDGGVHDDIIYPTLSWRIEYPDGSVHHMDGDHGRNYGNDGCDWSSEYD